MRANVWLFVGALMLAACSDGGTGPSGGSLNVYLTTPNSDDGAVLFTITGAPVDSVVGVNDQLYSARSGPNTLQVIATGNLQNGAVARIYVADIRLTAKYSGAIQQVAARGVYVQRDVAPYSLRVAP